MLTKLLTSLKNDAIRRTFGYYFLFICLGLDMAIVGPTLPALATQTSRIHLGTLVACAPFRHPGLVAKMATVIDLTLLTSLVSVIAVADLSYVALQVRSETYRYLEVLTAMAGMYWLMGYPQAKLVDWLHRRYKVVE